MKYPGLQWKIFRYLLLFSAVLLLLLWLFQVVFLNEFYQKIKINELKTTASAIEKNINQKDLRNILRSFSKHRDISIELLTNNGSSLYSYKIGRDFALEQMSAIEKLELLLKAQKQGGEYITSFSERPAYVDFQERVAVSMLMAKIIPTENGESLGLLIGAPISPIDATVGTLRRQFYYIAAFMLCFSILLALMITKKVSAPIEQLSSKAKLLAHGDYNVHFDASGYLEIKELSDTLNEMTLELSKVENLRRELIANISHDLRTPLTLITGYAEIMRDIPGENNAENVEVIIEESKRLSSLVSDILDLSVLQAESDTLHLNPYPLSENIRTIVHRLNEFLRNDGYHIRYESGPEVFVLADADKLSQIIYNLLINAVNYTGENKQIDITCVRSEHEVRIAVRDYGEGIDPDMLPHIWDRYYKADKNHKRPVAGTGLGLSIVKTLVEKHHGVCGVDSTIGEGSTFWFTLPLI